MAAPGSPVAVVPARAGLLAPGGAEVVAAVAEAGGRVILVGDELDVAAVELTGLVDEVRGAEVPFAPGALAAPLLADATFVLLPASPDGRDLAPRLAAELALPLLAGALQVGAGEVVVARHGGLVQSTVTPSGPFVATLQPGVRHVAPAADQGPPRVVDLPLAATSRRDATSIEVLPPDAATMDLAEAPRIVGAGAGLMVGEPDEIRGRIERLVALGESIGASMG